jgi:hypothetical protein
MPFDDRPDPGPVTMRLLGISEAWTGTPLYLADYDVDANDGRGSVVITADRRRALRFASPATALKAWRMQSRVRPLRPDNRPNRPLTAYTVEIQPC